MGDIELSDQLRRGLISSWHQFLEALDPIRPDLYRYCRRLTGNIWDAEDLVQETLLRAFSHLSQVLYSLENPRAYILRVASHLWIDTVRRRTAEAEALARRQTIRSNAPVRESSAQRRSRFARRARSSCAPGTARAGAMSSKDVFDMSIDETARFLCTTPGAVKAALHRGRRSSARSSGKADRDTHASIGRASGSLRGAIQRP